MRLTQEEKLMYAVMKAIYDSGAPISFKGSMVLKACLLEAGFSDDTRHTVDIDANWYTETQPSPEQIVSSLQEALNQNGIDLGVSMYRMFGEGRSAGFDLTLRNSDTPLFSMDIDVNRPAVLTKVYEVEGFRFRGVVPTQMLADKVSVVSSDKVFRRIKDVIDLYYLSKVIEFHKCDVLRALESSGRALGGFHDFLHRRTELDHAYEKFRFTGDVGKPAFDEVYCSVKSYIHELLPIERTPDIER